SSGRCRPAILLRSSPLLLAQKKVDGPAPTHMKARLTQMGQEPLVGAAGVFESVGKDGKPLRVEGAGRQLPFFVSGRGQCRHGGRSPSRVEGDGPEEVAEDVVQQYDGTRSFPAIRANYLATRCCETEYPIAGGIKRLRSKCVMCHIPSECPAKRSLLGNCPR